MPTKKFDDSTVLESSGHTPDRLALELPPEVAADPAAGQRTRHALSRRHRLSNRDSNARSVGHGIRSDNILDRAPGLADLVWKYFGAEIGEALLEAQESLPESNNKPIEQQSNGKQAGK